MTIRRLLLLAFIALFIYTLSAFLNLRALQHQRDEALVFNLASRQRMLIQQMRLQVFGIQIGENPAYRETLDETAHVYFEQTLNALIAGGPAIYVDERTVTLPPTQHPEILAQLETVRATWEPMHAAIHRALEADPQSEDFKAAAAEVERRAPELLAQMDAAVRMYEEDTRRDLTGAYTNQLSFTAVLAAIVVFALIVAERLILKPIVQLGAAARRIGEGNLTTSVPVSGVGELSQLARRLDDMRRSLAASAEAQAAILKLSRCLISTTDERAVAECAVEVGATALAADFCALMLPDAEGRLMARAGHGWPEEIIGRFEAAGGDASQTGYTLQHGHPLAVEDYAREMAFTVPPVVFEQGIVSGLSVPMFLEKRVMGALLVHTRTRRRFGDDDIQLLSLIANQTAVALEKARLYAEAQRRGDQLRALHEAGRALASDLRLESILRTLIEVAQRLTDARYGALAVLDAGGTSVAHFHTVGLTEAEQGRIGEPPRGRGVLGTVLSEGIPIRVDDLARDPRAAGFPPHHPLMKTFMGVPIVARGKIIGSLYLTDKVNDQPFTQEDEALMVRLATDAASAIENARLFEEVQQLAATDSLTGLHNRRHWLELAGREFERARRYGRPLAAIMLDVDHFKQVNDAYGHAIGDQVLRLMASRCRENLREIDLLGRYGGEEFAALLPENDLDSTRNAAERLRQCVAEAPFDTLRGPLTITISVGVAALTASCPELPDLLNQADAAMYAAKAAGRNRVVMS